MNAAPKLFVPNFVPRFFAALPRPFCRKLHRDMESLKWLGKASAFLASHDTKLWKRFEVRLDHSCRTALRCTFDFNAIRDACLSQANAPKPAKRECML